MIRKFRFYISNLLDPIRPKCWRCKFHVTGECHRYPPYIREFSHGLSPIEREHPRVSSGDWCGEFKPQ